MNDIFLNIIRGIFVLRDLDMPTTRNAMLGRQQNSDDIPKIRSAVDADDANSVPNRNSARNQNTEDLITSQMVSDIVDRVTDDTTIRTASTSGDADSDFRSEDDEVASSHRRRARANRHEALVRRIDFSEIEGSVPKFSGDNPYSVDKWIVDYEMVATSLGCDERQIYLYGRRLLTGTAELMLRMRKKIVDWKTLKAALHAEFRRRVSVRDVHEQLRQRFKKKEESMHFYILSMEEIAEQANVSERDLIDFIVDGLRDSSPYIAVLESAEDLDELKSLLIRYERRKKNSAVRELNAQSSTTKKYSDGAGVKKRSADTKGEVQCYNCSKLGHISVNCMEKRRAPGSCFVCGDPNHFKGDCPQRRRVSFAADGRRDVTLEDDLTEEINVLQMVSLMFIFDKVRNDKLTEFLSLFDTGSPVSFMQRSLLPLDCITGELLDSNFKGINSEKILTYGKIRVLIKFKKYINELYIIVVPDVTLPVPLLLGRDFLRKFNIELYLNNKKNGKFKQMYLKKKVYSDCSPVQSVKDVDLKINNKISCSLENETVSELFQNSKRSSKISALVDSASTLGGELRHVDDVSYIDSDFSVGIELADHYPPAVDEFDCVSRILHNDVGVLSELVDGVSTLGDVLCHGGDMFYTNSDFSSGGMVEIVDPCPPVVCGLHRVSDIPDGDVGLSDPCFTIADGSNFVCAIDSDIYLNDGIDVDPLLPVAFASGLRDLISCSYLNYDGPKVSASDAGMVIRLTSDVPIFSAPRRLSFREKQEVNDIVGDLLKQGIIRHSDSPYASPIVLVKKKSGETRMCVDYRALNKITVRDNYPLPLIEDCVAYLENKKYFSVLDLKSGFHQVRMSEDSAMYTSFVTPSGQYEYVRMPFGLKNAPSVFQRFISKILRRFTSTGRIVVYMDDIIVASKDFHEHVALLKDVLACVAENGLELKMSKCHFAYGEIEYLGYLVSSRGIRPSDGHLRAIRNYPRPRNTRELHSFLGLCSYFRKFVPSFSRKARPLLNLMKRDANFEFTGECEAAFDYLRGSLSSAPVLAIYGPDRETELHCDASALGFGAVLLQRQDDGKFHPTAYFSKSTSDAESRYHSFELETLAIIYALRRFRVYLEGIPFKVVTDCNSLTMTLKKRDINPRIARWALELENYNYEVHHRSGVSMGHVDALSRCKIVGVIDSEDIDFQLRLTQNRDPIISALKEKLSKSNSGLYEMRDGIVFRRDRRGELFLYVPSEMESNLIRYVHEKIGHMGITKCYEQLRMNYWFPEMLEKITRFTKNCLKCIVYSAPARSNERQLYSIPKAPLPFHTIHLDHFGPLPAIKSKRKHILVVIDAFTKFVKLYPVVSTGTREVCASLNRYFEYYSRPSRIVSDRGSCFTSAEFGAYVSDHNITHVKVAVASPQANGQVERVNRTLRGILSKLSEPMEHSDWVKQLVQVEYALNNSVQRSVQSTPSMLLFGVNQRGVIVDKLTEFLDDKFMNEKSRDLKKIREDASACILRTQAYNSDQFGARNRSARAYKEGDYVVMKNVDTTIGTNKKFVPKFRGPYVVHRVLPHDRYVLRDVEGCQITQIPYDGVVESRHLRLWRESLDDR